MNQDTICAIATANGVGALGIIRLSGNDAVKIAQRTFKGTNLENVKSHTVHYGYIVDFKQVAGDGLQEIGGDSEAVKTNNPTPNAYDLEEVIDEVMVSVFLAPKTFTTEDVVEISFHGSPHIAKKILEV
ncbi:MAG: hypothetical protein LC122_10820, partial [Chitinophagales bacterium]|nr:hypothetical protein [Chitinophagales bacterium]